MTDPLHMKWEYRIIDGVGMNQHMLNEYGNDGWELCGVKQYDRRPYEEHIFKRPKGSARMLESPVATDNFRPMDTY